MEEEITISLCMIVRDEEGTIARCLNSVKEIVDEMIIVDTGSVDRTKEIASEYTPHIYNFEWIDDFAAARNFSFSKATQEYILWLDADDVLPGDSRESLKALKKELDRKVDSVSMLYHLTFDVNGNPSYSSRRNRLVKRECNFKWFGKVHEYLAVYGEILRSDIGITHEKEKEWTNRNLKIYESAVARGEELSPRDVYYYANECVDNQKYEEAIVLYEKFLNDGLGWKEDNINAAGKLGDCYEKLEQWQKAIEACIRSFHYDIPRGEICTQLGSIYMVQEKYKEAIYWYKTATEVPVPTDAPFYNPTNYTWVPFLQLCVCHSRLGQQEKAYYYNELAATYVPDHPAIAYNRNYFKSLFE
ncbi:beta 1,4 glucosyltransferase [Bacillus manliponensis]|uniref:Beta 1,4 glucosyltransferase n=2 Tax=Bacillus manliponensis TaxID=574376 RepID=A0A073K161_9BACI|nr:beta 1,4 glucosyltransferase [Bacillus manliponensis]